MPKQRAGEFLHSIYNSAHLVTCSDTQTREPEGSNCPHKLPAAPRKSRKSRDGRWRMAEQAGVHPPTQLAQPAQGPEMLQLATSSKPQQATPCSAA